MALDNAISYASASILMMVAFLSLRTQSLSLYSTDEIWSTTKVNYRRPNWSKNISIIYDNLQIWSLEGIVVPLSTIGRPSAPNPYNGAVTGTSVNLDKGHIMALSNGGPDINYNIVPQSSQWQRNGGWRKLEVIVFNYAMSKYGWNQSDIYLASEVESVQSPGTHNFVIFNVTMSEYDTNSGQPMKYNGFVKSGNSKQGANIYSFSITPEQNAVWIGNKSPPNNASFIETTESPGTTSTQHVSSSTTIETTSAKKKHHPEEVAIVLVIGLLIFLVVIAFFAHKWIVACRVEDDENYDNHGQVAFVQYVDEY